jgi:hypothetical protein
MAENQTNIEKTDEVTGYLGRMGGIAVCKAFLVPNVHVGNAYKN